MVYMISPTIATIVLLFTILRLACSGTCGGIFGDTNCRTGSDCYSLEYDWCDSREDCNDGSDEDSCTEADCPWFGRASAIVWCHSTQRCFHNRQTTCGCVPNCRDGETCCTDGSGCFTEAEKCDRANQCHNGFDEKYCYYDDNSFPWAVLIMPAVFILVIIMVVVICCYKKRQRDQMFLNAQATGPIISGGGIPLGPQPLQATAPPARGQHQHNTFNTSQGVQYSSVPTNPGGQAPPPSYQDVMHNH